MKLKMKIIIKKNNKVLFYAQKDKIPKIFNYLIKGCLNNSAGIN